MSGETVGTANGPASQFASSASGPASLAAADWAVADPSLRRFRVFRLSMHVVNLLLFVSLCASLYAAVWEYSTRRYLKGFSDIGVQYSTKFFKLDKKHDATVLAPDIVVQRSLADVTAGRDPVLEAALKHALN